MPVTSRDITRPAAIHSDAASLREYQGDLTRALGPVLGGSELSAALGFRTQEAFRKARERGTLPVNTFAIPGRRGRFAATADIAAWLWSQRHPPSSR